MNEAARPVLFYLVIAGDDISILQTDEDMLDLFAQGIRWIDAPFRTRAEAEQKLQALLGLAGA